MILTASRRGSPDVSRAGAARGEAQRLRRERAKDVTPVATIVAAAAVLEATEDYGTAVTKDTEFFAEAEHTHLGTNVTLNPAGWNGLLKTSDVTNVQELADFLDANVAPL